MSHNNNAIFVIMEFFQNKLPGDTEYWSCDTSSPTLT